MKLHVGEVAGLIQLTVTSLLGETGASQAALSKPHERYRGGHPGDGGSQGSTKRAMVQGQAEFTATG